MLTVHFFSDYLRIAFSFIVLLHSYEFFKSLKNPNFFKIWDWNILKNDYFVQHFLIQNFLNFFLRNDHFSFVVYTRAVLSILLLIFPTYYLPLGILFLTLLISIRFRGSYNGGSDFMTIVLAQVITLLLIFKERESSQKILFIYLSFQVSLSYFLAGVAKLKNKLWIEGKAISIFLNSPHYAPPVTLKKILNMPLIEIAGGYGVIIFELFFFFIFIFDVLVLPFLIFGVIFHLLNYHLFGLNRFFWCWIASYPIIYFVCSQF